MTATTRLLTVLSLSALAVGCGTTQESAPTSSATPAPVERSSATPRLALTYDGGVLVVDAGTLKPIADVPVEGFTRLNPAGNGRHVLVSQSGGFAALDMGTWTEAHGDHGHYYTAPPTMTDIRYGGAEPGHVVAHDDMLTLFSDGTGDVEVVDPRTLLKGDGAVEREFVTEPHHGVAVARADGSVVMSVGDEDTRTGAKILDRAGVQVVANDRCPALHGEAAAADGVLTFGCQDGILIVRGNDIRKAASPDAYGRIGNQSGSEESPIVLGDYRPIRTPNSNGRNGSR